MSTSPKALPSLIVRDSPGLLPGKTLELEGTEVHVWRQPIRLDDAQVRLISELLSPEELKRAKRYKFEASRCTFIVCRGMLRMLLSGYVGEPPAKLEFSYTDYGKPELIGPGGEHSVEFNISHSEGLALLAFSRGRRIGIDLERVRADFNTSEIAERFFSDGERGKLREVVPDGRFEAFFRCWTRKEAFIKALGEGLSHPLDSFDVSVERGSPALLATRPVLEEAARWQLWDIDVPDSYIAALATEVA